MTGSVSGRGAGAQGLEEAEAGPVATLSSQGCAWGLLRALATVFVLIKMNLSLGVPGADCGAGAHGGCSANIKCIVLLLWGACSPPAYFPTLLVSIAVQASNLRVGRSRTCSNELGFGRGVL